jgi:hypothetical protein
MVIPYRRVKIHRILVPKHVQSYWAEETPDPTHWGFIGYLICKDEDEEQFKEQLMRNAKQSLKDAIAIDSSEGPENAKAWVTIGW